MVAKLLVVDIETGTNPKNAEYNPGEPFTRTTFLDDDPTHKLKAFLKWSDAEGRSLKKGEVVQFAVSGLRPVKQDRSSFYLNGSIMSGKNG